MLDLSHKVSGYLFKNWRELEEILSFEVFGTKKYIFVIFTSYVIWEHIQKKVFLTVSMCGTNMS